MAIINLQRERLPGTRASRAQRVLADPDNYDDAAYRNARLEQSDDERRRAAKKLADIKPEKPLKPERVEPTRPAPDALSERITDWERERRRQKGNVIVM